MRISNRINPRIRGVISLLACRVRDRACVLPLPGAAQARAGVVRSMRGGAPAASQAVQRQILNAY